MAYQEYVISTLGDIPNIVSAFATTLGMAVTGDPSAPIVGNPNLAPGLLFQLQTELVGALQTIKWQCTTDANRRCRTINPIHEDTANNVTTVQPTKLYLIGMLEPKPYIAIVIEYGYNLYRHLYMGWMEQVGEYTGGAALASVSGPISRVDGDYSWRTGSQARWLFTAHANINDKQDRGGVEVIAADVANPWRYSYIADNVAVNGDEVLGGFLDGINEPVVAKARSSFAGAAILTPINLYISRPLLAGDRRWRAIGRPTGVRMINLQEIDVQTQVEVGSEVWHSFPAIARNPDPAFRRQAVGFGHYIATESSYYLGYAYRG